MNQSVFYNIAFFELYYEIRVYTIICVIGLKKRKSFFKWI